MNILLATDGSETARAAGDLLLRFPFPDRCTVTLLGVIDAHLFIDAESVELTSEQREAIHAVSNSVREEMQLHLDELAARTARAGWDVVTRLRTGDVAEEIVMAAEELGAELVIVGSHGHSGLQHFILGSVSSKVLNYAPCSVLIVKEPAAQEIPPGKSADDWRLLLAYDDSGPAREAVSLCSSLPFGPRDEIVVVSVLAMVTAWRQDIRQYMSPIWQQKKIAASAALDGAVARLHGATPNVSSGLREGESSADEILQAAAESGSNLIMIGYKEEKAMRRLLLGSITSHVAHHAACSVWVVRD